MVQVIQGVDDSSEDHHTHHSSVTVHWVYVLQVQTSVLSTLVPYMHDFTAASCPNLYLTFFPWNKRCHNQLALEMGGTGASHPYLAVGPRGMA